MRRLKTQSIGEALVDFLRESGLEQPFLERKVVELWPSVMGETVSGLTRKIEVKDGVLYAYINSAALKSQLFECRHELIDKLNQAVGGGQVIRDVRLLG